MSVLAPARPVSRCAPLPTRPARWRALAEETAAYAAPRTEAALAERWFAGLRAPSRVEDGRRLRIRFPGVPAPGYGPDARDAVIELDGAELRGEVELHLRASGWRAHGHHEDPAYARVVLHVVEENDGGALVTLHASGRAIPVAVAPPSAATAPLPAFAPPCVATAARSSPAPALERLGLERLRAKASRAGHWAASRGPAPVLYALALETLAGRRNREAFAEIARRLPLPALLDRCPAGPEEARAAAFAAALREGAAGLPLIRHGGRPAAAPERRLDALAALCARLWPGAEAVWPDALAEPASIPRALRAPGIGSAAALCARLWPGAEAVWPDALAEPASIPRALRAPGIGSAAALELAVNAVLPVALGARLWPEEAALARYRALPAPAPYGQIRSLGGWLRTGDDDPLARAAALQGALQLHARHCSRGACGACPLS